jgi:hypothetical protein
MLFGALPLLGFAFPMAAGVFWLLALAVIVAAGIVAAFNFAAQRHR